MDFFEPADIVIYIQGRGIVLKEKSLVAFDNVSGKIAAFGKEAEDMVKNPAEHIKIISPMKRGSIADYMAAVKLFQYLLKKAIVCQTGNCSMCFQRNYNGRKKGIGGCFVSDRRRKSFCCR